MTYGRVVVAHSGRDSSAPWCAAAGFLVLILVPALVWAQSSAKRNKTESDGVVVLIHGTTVVGSADWHRPGSPAYEFLAKRTDARILSFNWSGGLGAGLGEDDRDVAARDLQVFIRRNVPPGKRVHLVAHSHGGNVALRALDNGMRAENLVLLGTPILEQYLHAVPSQGGRRVANVGRIYNVFDERDCVQVKIAQGEPDPLRGGERPQRRVSNVLNATNIDAQNVLWSWSHRDSRDHKPAVPTKEPSCTERHSLLHETEVLQPLIDLGKLPALPFRKGDATTAAAGSDPCPELRSKVRDILGRDQGVQGRQELLQRKLALFKQMTQSQDEAEKASIRAEMQRITAAMESQDQQGADARDVEKMTCEELERISERR